MPRSRRTALPRTVAVAAAAAAGALVASAAPASAAQPAVAVAALVRTPAGLVVEQAVVAGQTGVRRQAERWWRSPATLAVSVVQQVEVLDDAPDPLAPLQWGLPAVGSATPHPAAGRGTVVAVLDTGVDASHPDLAGAVLPGIDLVDEGGDGRIDPGGHGTAVAGVVAARARNGLGVTGLAPGASVLPVRVMGADGRGTDVDVARGLLWAVEHGADVVNLSLGTPARSTVLEGAVAHAVSRGVVVVAAAGNSGSKGDPALWPAAAPGAIAVAAVAPDGSRPAWSSTGSHVALAAPGAGIWSTSPGGRYSPRNGTSLAAPFVSAAAALLLAADRRLSPAAVRERLATTAADLGAPGADPAFGAGRLDLRALGVAPAAAPPAAPASSTASASASAPSASAPSASAPSASAPASSTRAPSAAAPQTGPAVVRDVAPDELRLHAARASGGWSLSARALRGGSWVQGAVVALQRRSGGAWTTVARTTSPPNGLVRWSARPAAAAEYRVVAGAVTSKPVRLTP